MFRQSRKMQFARIRPSHIVLRNDPSYRNNLIEEIIRISKREGVNIGNENDLNQLDTEVLELLFQRFDLEL